MRLQFAVSHLPPPQVSNLHDAVGAAHRQPPIVHLQAAKPMVRGGMASLPTNCEQSSNKRMPLGPHHLPPLAWSE